METRALAERNAYPKQQRNHLYALLIVFAHANGGAE